MQGTWNVQCNPPLVGATPGMEFSLTGLRAPNLAGMKAVATASTRKRARALADMILDTLRFQRRIVKELADQAGPPHLRVQVPPEFLKFLVWATGFGGCISNRNDSQSTSLHSILRLTAPINKNAMPR
jgi:hypothetical protein